MLLAVTLGFVLFNATDLSQALSDVGGMFGLGGVPLVTGQTLYYLRSYAIVLALGILGATPVVKNLALRVENKPVGAVLEAIVVIGLLLLCSAYLVDGSFNPFLYFRF